MLIAVVIVIVIVNVGHLGPPSICLCSRSFFLIFSNLSVICLPLSLSVCLSVYLSVQWSAVAVR